MRCWKDKSGLGNMQRLVLEMKRHLVKIHFMVGSLSFTSSSFTGNLSKLSSGAQQHTVFVVKEPLHFLIQLVSLWEMRSIWRLCTYFNNIVWKL